MSLKLVKNRFSPFFLGVLLSLLFIAFFLQHRQKLRHESGIDRADILEQKIPVPMNAKLEIRFLLPEQGTAKAWFFHKERPNRLVLFHTSNSDNSSKANVIAQGEFHFAQEWQWDSFEKNSFPLQPLKTGENLIQGELTYCDDEAGNHCSYKKVSFRLQEAKLTSNIIEIALPKP